MRNLLEYPVIGDEALSVLDRYCQIAGDDDGIGSMDSIVMCALYNFLDKNPEVLATYLKELNYIS